MRGRSKDSALVQIASQCTDTGLVGAGSSAHVEIPKQTAPVAIRVLVSDAIHLIWSRAQRAVSEARAVNQVVEMVCISGGRVAHSWVDVHDDRRVTRRFRRAASACVREPALPRTTHQWTLTCVGNGNVSRLRFQDISGRQQAFKQKPAHRDGKPPRKFVEHVRTSMDTRI